MRWPTSKLVPKVWFIQYMGSLTTSCFSHRKNWTMKGWLKPRLSRICSRTSGGIVSGRFAVGSDGDSFTMKKMTKLMNSSVGMASARRRIV